MIKLATALNNYNKLTYEDETAKYNWPIERTYLK